MTGCPECGVGPDDECSMDCPSRDRLAALREAESCYQGSFQRAEADREARNAAVRAAFAAGWTHARISDATGLTRGRIGQIAKP